MNVTITAPPKPKTKTVSYAEAQEIQGCFRCVSNTAILFFRASNPTVIFLTNSDGIDGVNNGLPLHVCGSNNGWRNERFEKIEGAVTITIE